MQEGYSSSSYFSPHTPLGYPGNYSHPSLVTGSSSSFHSQTKNLPNTKFANLHLNLALTNSLPSNPTKSCFIPPSTAMDVIEKSGDVILNFEEGNISNLQPGADSMSMGGEKSRVSDPKVTHPVVASESLTEVVEGSAAKISTQVSGGLDSLTVTEPSNGENKHGQKENLSKKRLAPKGPDNRAKKKTKLEKWLLEAEEQRERHIRKMQEEADRATMSIQRQFIFFEEKFNMMKQDFINNLELSLGAGQKQPKGTQ